MTTEEKLQHFYEFSMESARKEAKEMLDEYGVALNNIFKEHQDMKERQAKAQLDDEANTAKREINKALSNEQIQIRRTLSKKQNEMKEELFDAVKEKLTAFKSTPAYKEYLCKKMRDALEFAGGDEMVIYIDPSDSSMADSLGQETGVTPTISRESFFGGIRAVISSKNILIDNSFTSMMREQKDAFTFDGGMTHE